MPAVRHALTAILLDNQTLRHALGMAAAATLFGNSYIRLALWVEGSAPPLKLLLLVDAEQRGFPLIVVKTCMFECETTHWIGVW